MKKIISVLLSLLLVLSLTSCKVETKLQTQSLGIEHETKFGGFYVYITIDDFNNLGFEYGDSLDIKLSNGKEYLDIPYYTGYYTNRGGTLMVAYPGYPYIKLCVNNGGDIYLEDNLTEDLTAVVSLHEKGKYSVVQESLNITYSSNRDNYNSDEEFANFRPMNGGNIILDYFYRGATPCDNQYNRAPYASKLLEENGVKYLIDLADSEEETKGYFNDAALDCPYWKSLYENNKILTLDMSANYGADDYKASVIEILKTITKEEGPFYIHCTEGKDRTGFVCLVIETLAGFSVDEIINDYMITHNNYYGINKETNEEKYNVIKNLYLADMTNFLCNEKDLSKVTEDMLEKGVIDYLKSGSLTDDEIEDIKLAITK